MSLSENNIWSEKNLVQFVALLGVLQKYTILTEAAQKYLTAHDVLRSHKLTVQVQQVKYTLLDQTQQLDNKQVNMDVQLDVHDKGDGDWVTNLSHQSSFTAFFNGGLDATTAIIYQYRDMGTRT